MAETTVTEYNTIPIESFPEIDELLSSDQIILFEKDKNGKLSPRTYSVSDLSAVIIAKGNLEDITSKVEEVKAAIVNAMNYLRKNFVTKTEAENTYATKTLMDVELAKLDTTKNFIDNRLQDKATSEYLDWKYNELRADCAMAKTKLGGGKWIHNTGRRNKEGKGYKPLTAATAKKKEE